MRKEISAKPISLFSFKKIIWSHYKKQKREFAWRDTRSPYKILISEIMLQQTQVHRVITKYEQFIQTFPDFATLAKAPLFKILKVWQGMGYNRRALYLKQIAETVIEKYHGILPDSVRTLDELPGIAHNTACSIMAFAFNKPVVFVETNIRAVFIHFFFKNKINVHDKEILPLVEKTLDKKNPREWYFALMDYGAYLKKQYKNPNHASAHYAKQSKFEGSNRQLRGRILKILLEKNMTLHTMQPAISARSGKLKLALAQLIKENLIKKTDKYYIVV